ncbi:MAG: FAD-dependent oxidoreductase [Polyangiaceae bacterium]|nr:FAD-dependent oxidoreductase [Polyangiaceae bacterium]
MDRGTRIVIIGAGPAGLSAADTLHGLGYRNITVLERSSGRVGGKCLTVEFQGQKVERGAVFVLAGNAATEALLYREGLTTRPACPLTHIDAAGQTRPFGVPKSPSKLLEKTAEYARLGALLVKHRKLIAGGLGDADAGSLRDLATPMGEWVKAHRLRSLEELGLPLLRAFGFGLDEQKIPALYGMKVLPQLIRGRDVRALWDLSRIELRQVEEGYGELWRRVARPLNVKTGVAVAGIERAPSGITVLAGGEAIRCDHVILACPLDEALSFLDVSPEERELFSAIRWLSVFQAVARVEGIGEALLLDKNHSLEAAGHPVTALRYVRDEPLYYLFGYRPEGLDEEAIEANIRADVEGLGGRVEGPVGVTSWKYFPHYESREVEAGYHGRLEGLQGKRHTWYVGEIMANIGVDSAVTYARRLVDKAFGDKPSRGKGSK